MKAYLSSGSDFATQEKSLMQAKFPIVDNGVCKNKYKNLEKEKSLEKQIKTFLRESE